MRSAPPPLPARRPGASRPTLSPGSLVAAARRAWSAPRSAQAIVLVLAAWIVLVGNLALWRSLAAIDPGPRGVLLGLGVAVLLFAAVSLLFALTAWSRWMKPAWLFLLVAAGVSQHFMLDFGAVIDTTMIGNVVETHLGEAADLLGWGFVGHVLLVAGPPALWLVPLQVKRFALARTLLRVAVLLVAALTLAVAMTAAMYSALAPLVRNHMGLRYLPNPIVPVWSTVKVATRPLWHRSGPLVPITAGAALGASHAGVGTAAAAACWWWARPRGPTTSPSTAMRATPRRSWRRAAC